MSDRTLYTSDGQAVRLGPERGRGGEGTVYALESNLGQVAKVYARTPDRTKQAKLVHMIRAADESLHRRAAWPRDTVHESRGGPVVGFTMSDAGERMPVHRLYSPADRRRSRPTLTWRDLIVLGRNIAFAFEGLHAQGHVVGDVNQGNVLVNRKGAAILIDCDSFQIEGRGTRYLCEVGVGHFTPPELQGRSFASTVRTANHDAFGLALLVFHLLLGGRHPYSGVPLKSGVAERLENDISAFRYAYATDHVRRGIKPPPHAVPLAILPLYIREAFERAFTEAGVSTERPTAREWIRLLERLARELEHCARVKGHMHLQALTQCPWCAIERNFGIIHFPGRSAATATAARIGSFDLEAISRRAAVLVRPSSIVVPSVEYAGIKATQLPQSITPQWVVRLIQTAVVGLALTLTAVADTFFLYWFFIGLAVFFWVPNIGKSERESELVRRQQARAKAHSALQTLLTQLNEQAGPSAFDQQQVALATAIARYRALPTQKRAEYADLQSRASVRQLRDYLDRFLIENAQISGIGPGRISTLRSFGIETAADVESARIRRVSGFGDKRTKMLLAWRRSHERTFQFDPARTVSQDDRVRLEAEYRTRRVSLERELTDSVVKLEEFVRESDRHRARERPALQGAVHALAQAEQDLKAMAS